MKKKLLAFVCVGLMLCCGLGSLGCGKKNGNEGDLVIWAGGQWLGEDAENLQKYLAFVNDNYAETLGFRVKLEIQENIDIQISSSFNNNTQPDLMLWGRNQTAQFAVTDNFVSLDDYVERDGVELGAFNAPALDEMTYGGKLCGLPFDVDPWGLLVNLSAVKEYNASAAEGEKLSLEGPKTWTELKDFAKKLTKYGPGGEVTRAGLPVSEPAYHSFLASAGVDEIKDDAANFDNRPFKDFIALQYELLDAKVAAGGLTGQNIFANGSLAMMYASSYICRYAQRYAKDTELLYVPQPAYDVGGVVQEGAVRGGLLGGFGWVIPQSLEKFRTDAFYERVEMAWKFMRLLTETDALLVKWVETCGSIPALTRAADFEIVQENAVLKTMAETAADCRIRPKQSYFPTLDQQCISPAVMGFSALNQKNRVSAEDIISKLNLDCDSYIDYYRALAD